MAEKDVLSQEEIDALLHTVQDDNKTESSGNEAHENIKIINFSNQERILKGQLPVLEKIHDRAMHLFSADLHQIVAKDFEILQEPLAFKKYAEFMETIPNPSIMNVYKFKPLRGKGLIIFDSIFVYDVVDYYFGGSSQFLAQKERVDFTATEFKVIEKVSKQLVNNLHESWINIIKLNIVKASTEINPQLVNIGESNDIVLVTRFSVDFGQEIGSFYIVIPYSMVEPIKQQLELGVVRHEEEIDTNWIKSLREELMEVELEICASMSEAKSTLGKVMEWQSGDFISLECDEIVKVEIENNPKFNATLGTRSDKRALKIIDKI